MPRQFIILDAKNETGVGIERFVEDYEHLIISLNTEGNANLTVKFQTSYQDDAPDFSAAQSKTNQWDYVQVVDMEDGVFTDGDTGIIFTGTDDNRQFELNLNGARWVNMRVTARSAGSITAYIKAMKPTAK